MPRQLSACWFVSRDMVFSVGAGGCWKRTQFVSKRSEYERTKSEREMTVSLRLSDYSSTRNCQQISDCANKEIRHSKDLAVTQNRNVNRTWLK
jgi:hypothetical protein